MEYTFLHNNADGTTEWRTTQLQEPGIYGAIQNTYVGQPEAVSLQVIINDLINKGVPDITINGYKLSGLIQSHAIFAVDALRRGTVAHIQKVEKESAILRDKLIRLGETNNPVTGRAFREEE